MSGLKRVTVTILGNINSIVSRLENHEAMVDAAIEEAQQSTARAKVQFARVKSDGAQRRKRLEELREEIVTWEDRARRTATEDEARALECVRRARRAARELETLEEQDRSHEALAVQLGHDIELLDARIVTLRQQRNLMRTRESRAAAIRAVHDHGTGLLSEIDDIFDRWESKVIAYEIGTNLEVADPDTLKEQFEEAERQDELRATLKTLLETPR